MLKAVILAGGRGDRLRPLTDTVPKPMIEINGKPFLQYQVELLREYRISEIVLCVGYLKDRIMDYFGNGSPFKLNIKYSVEKGFLGTAGALKAAATLLGNDFILVYGDSYLPIDYAEFVNFGSRHNDASVVACYDNKTKIAQNNILLDKKNFVKAYDKHHPDKKMNHVEAGVAILKRQILDIIPEGRTVSLEDEIFPVLIKEKRLRGYPTSQRFYDIGTLKGLHEIEEVLK